MSDEAKIKGPDSGYDPFQVNLPLFDGPLDLLLHLVRKQQLDINELRLAELTQPYLDYLEQIKEMNLDQAGDFLTIASTLVWIKSKTLLPREFDEEELDPETVEEMLLLRLQEYQKIKEAAHELTHLDTLGKDVFPRRAPADAPAPSADEPVFEEVSLFALIEAFREILERSEADSTLHVIPERERVEDKLREMLVKLTERKSLYFHDLLSTNSGRGEIILAFIAMLELVRLKAIRVVQAADGGGILCQVTELFAESGAELISTLLGTLLGEQAHEDEATPDTPATDA
jgi:segregation and condensation protein A